jgi:hypothetical protein
MKVSLLFHKRKPQNISDIIQFDAFIYFNQSNADQRIWVSRSPFTTIRYVIHDRAHNVRLD